MFPWLPCRCIVSSHWTSITLSAGTQLELEEGGSASQAPDWEGFSFRRGSLESLSFLSSHALHLTRSFLHLEGVFLLVDIVGGVGWMLGVRVELVWPEDLLDEKENTSSPFSPHSSTSFAHVPDFLQVWEKTVSGLGSPWVRR